MPPAAKNTDPQKSTIDGPTKAAIWLLSTDEQSAVTALKQMEEDELKRIGKAVRKLEKVNAEQLKAIHQELELLTRKSDPILKGSTQYLKRIAQKALGDSRAALIIKEEEIPKAQKAINSANSESLAKAMVEQHPQIIAALLASMDPDRSKDVLSYLPDEILPNVIQRIAQLSVVSRDSLERAQESLCADLPKMGDADLNVDGIRLTASILNRMDALMAEDILKNMPASNLAENVRQAMFTFEDLIHLERRDLQVILKEVNGTQLLIALKMASEKLSEKIFGSLSKRAGDMMREDMEMMGPVKLTEVEGAQQAIVEVAVKLRSEGRIKVTSGGGFV